MHYFFFQIHHISPKIEHWTIMKMMELNQSKSLSTNKLLQWLKLSGCKTSIFNISICQNLVKIHLYSSSKCRHKYIWKIQSQNKTFLLVQNTDGCIRGLTISFGKTQLGKPSFKKYRNFMKYFHKTVTCPPPVLHLWNPYSDFATGFGVFTFSE